MFYRYDVKIVYIQPFARVDVSFWNKLTFVKQWLQSNYDFIYRDFQIENIFHHNIQKPLL